MSTIECAQLSAVMNKHEKRKYACDNDTGICTKHWIISRWIASQTQN